MSRFSGISDVSFHFWLNQRRKLRWKMKLVSRQDLQIAPLIFKQIFCLIKIMSITLVKPRIARGLLHVSISQAWACHETKKKLVPWQSQTKAMKETSSIYFRQERFCFELTLSSAPGNSSLETKIQKYLDQITSWNNIPL